MGTGVREKITRGPCQLCGTMQSLTGHHLVPQRWFRSRPVTHCHSVHNVVPLCVWCHRGIEGYGPSSVTFKRERRMQKRSDLRAALTPEEWQFVVRLRGPQWLDQTYPLSVPRHDDKRRRSALALN